MIKNKGISNECLQVGKGGIKKNNLLAQGLPMNRYERRMLKRIRKRERNNKDFQCDY